MPKCNIFTYFFDNFLLTILKKCFIIQLRKILPQNPERTTAMLLNKNWKMLFNGEILPCRGFPVSMYRTLLANGRIDDPYYGENQYDAKELSRKDCEFICEFEPEGEIFAEDKVFLRFFGIDTLSEVYLNGNILFGGDNMFVTYEYEIRGLLKRGLNTPRKGLGSARCTEWKVRCRDISTYARLITCTAGTGECSYPIWAYGGMLRLWENPYAKYAELITVRNSGTVTESLYLP